MTDEDIVFRNGGLIVEETKAAAETPAEDDQWVEGLWQATFPMLTCRLCQWDTLDGRAAALEHKATCPRCAPPPPPASTEALSSTEIIEALKH